MTGDRALENLLPVVSQAYLAATQITELPGSYEEARQHESGDLLADWIVIELHEVLAGRTGSMQELQELAFQAMQRGSEELRAAAESLRPLELRRNRHQWFGRKGDG